MCRHVTLIVLFKLVLVLYCVLLMSEHCPDIVEENCYFDNRVFLDQYLLINITGKQH